jgi:hypothetical protein
MTSSVSDASAKSFPQLSTQHGIEMVRVEVGSGTGMQAFNVHKNLLSQASEYFDRALNGNFKESEGVFRLPHHRPEVFEVVYQWLYTGRQMVPGDILPEDYDVSNTLLNHNHKLIIFWIRVFKFADETMINEIKIFAYERLLKSCELVRYNCMPPAAEALALVWDRDSPQPILQRLLVGVSAWQIIEYKHIMLISWRGCFEAYPAYALMVLDRIAVISSKATDWMYEFPSNDVEFSAATVFRLPAPAKSGS